MARINKKGNLDDLVYIIGALIFIGMLTLITGKWVMSLNDEIQEQTIIPAEGKTAVSQIEGLYGGAIDNGFLFLTVGLAIVAILFAMLVVVHPIFFIFYFILLAVVIFVSGAVSNIYQTAAAEPAMFEIAAQLLWTSQILTYLPFITGILGFIIAIVMYKNWEQR